MKQTILWAVVAISIALGGCAKQTDRNLKVESAIEAYLCYQYFLHPNLCDEVTGYEDADEAYISFQLMYDELKGYEKNQVLDFIGAHQYVMLDRLKEGK